MSSLRKTLLKNSIIRFFSSTKLTVVCLFFLFVLTFWGTVAQVENGLYQAQERYFYSYIFLVWGFLPFPGAKLVLWVMFVNISMTLLTKFQYTLANLGILIIHLGLLTYFGAAFVTYQWAKESNVTLMEGASTNLTSAYHDWELSVWNESGHPEKEVQAYDTKDFKTGRRLTFSQPGFSAKIQKYYPNSSAYTTDNVKEPKHLNSSGIHVLEPSVVKIEPEKNLPGIIFDVEVSGQDVGQVLLFGGEPSPTRMTIAGETIAFQLRRRRDLLPFQLRLLDFRMEKHPNTEIARSYESTVEMTDDHSSRETVIFMNNPLRYKDFTLYQASYAIDQMGRELSTFAVVKNGGRLLPYYASGFVLLGLIVHFLLAGALRKIKHV